MSEILDSKVTRAMYKQDISLLKEVLPTPLDLLKYRSSDKWDKSGDTILHYALKRGTLAFTEELLDTYFPKDADQETLDIKKQLLLTRNRRHKLCADFSYAKYNFSPSAQEYHMDARSGKAFEPGYQVPDLPDNRTPSDVEISKIYNFLKKQIKAVADNVSKEDAHVIGDKNSDELGKGIPVSAYYLPELLEKPFMVKEKYPTVRLRHIATKENEKDEVVVLNDIELDSPENFITHAFDKMDFPEDWMPEFGKTLKEFKNTYEKLREDPLDRATSRFFFANKGSLVFEDNKDPETRVAFKPGANTDYGGYAGVKKDAKTGEEYPLVVLRTNSGHNSVALLHELFHQVDLRGEINFSSMDIVQNALFLAETSQTNKNGIVDNRSSQERFIGFHAVNTYYSPTAFAKEMVAQIMSYPAEKYQDAPMLKKLYQLGNAFAFAKVEDIAPVLQRMTHMMDTMAEAQDLKSLSNAHMATKEKNYKDEGAIKSKYPQSGKMDDASRAQMDRELRDLKEAQKEQFSIFQKEFAPEQKRLEAALSQKIDDALKTFEYFKENPKLGKDIFLSPALIQFGEQALNQDRPIESYLESKKSLIQKGIDQGFIPPICRQGFIEDPQTNSEKLELVTAVMALNMYAQKNDIALPDDLKMNQVSAQDITSDTLAKSAEDVIQKMGFLNFQNKKFKEAYPDKELPKNGANNLDNVKITELGNGLNRMSSTLMDNLNLIQSEKNPDGLKADVLWDIADGQLVGRVVAQNYERGRAFLKDGNNSLLNISRSLSRIGAVDDDNALGYMNALGAAHEAHKALYPDQEIPQELKLSSLTSESFKSTPEKDAPIKTILENFEERAYDDLNIKIKAEKLRASENQDAVVEKPRESENQSAVVEKPRESGSITQNNENVSSALSVTPIKEDSIVRTPTGIKAPPPNIVGRSTGSESVPSAMPEEKTPLVQSPKRPSVLDLKLAKSTPLREVEAPKIPSARQKREH